MCAAIESSVDCETRARSKNRFSHYNKFLLSHLSAMVPLKHFSFTEQQKEKKTSDAQKLYSWCFPASSANLLKWVFSVMTIFDNCITHFTLGGNSK